ncbi:Major facilitator superfamily general substrate transporter [Cordyceps militaris]|uniref:Major facilitator superfamily general substrate transporter n=1 Tax=Cordyceps militaris TaxID=73501 RepID=A0A2H4S685_CORMI|nr:Major facilitator superfamily general substrate transporter [Cordyceps militaris]
MITPLEIFMIFKNPGTTLSILCYGLFYTMYSCLQTSLSTIFVEQYRVSGLAAGLSYLPFGVASMTAAIFAGKLLDKEYARVATSQGITLVKGRLDDLTDFPIERARLGVTKYAVLLCVPCIVGYGWALQYHAHMAVPLVLQFLIGFTTQVNFTSLNALLADYHSDRTATAQAACNLFRCELAAGALALLDVMLRRLGPGWCFVVIAVVHGVAFPSLWAVERYGLAWRRSGKQGIGGK